MAMVNMIRWIKRLSVIVSVLVLGSILTGALYLLVRAYDSNIGNQATALRNAGPPPPHTGTLPDTPAPKTPTPTGNGHERSTDISTSASVTEMYIEVLEIVANDGKRNRGVLVLPPGEGPFPGVVAVHGGMGEWPEHNLKLYATRSVGSLFPKHGYATLTADYRHPSLGLGEVQDVIAAYKTLCAHPKVDAKRVAVFGSSHGGISSLWASMQIRPKCIAVESCQTDVADGYRILEDRVREHGEPLPNRLKRDLTLWTEFAERMGGTPEEVPEAYAKASPYKRAAAIQSPLLIIQGTDRNIPHATKMHEAMLKAGRHCELKMYDNAPHAFLENTRDIPATRKAQRDLFEFLDRYLK